MVCRSICCYVFHSLLSCGGAFLKFLFLLRWLCKLFDKALPCGLACGALAMCLQNALAIVSSFDVILFLIELICLKLQLQFLNQNHHDQILHVYLYLNNSKFDYLKFLISYRHYSGCFVRIFIGKFIIQII